ncbi:hypothetical protein [Serratia fonticola]|uniref:hypothetical protein n=1 Tax=Serratia fonticola TaxID=47917 RepID=UPI003AAFA698|nr:hypothetical protein [Serratia fonticola]
MDKQTESRSQFEAEFRQRHSFVPEASMAMMLEQYNFGTDEEPDWGYYSLAARDAWEWWQKSRESLVVEIDSQTIPNGQPAAWLHPNSVPPGYKLVPVEPTFQICEILGCKWEAGEGFPARWASMLAKTNGEVI